MEESKMKIKFPDNFPKISDADLLTPISEWEKKNGIKGIVRDYKGGKPILTKKQFEKKFKKLNKTFTKILNKMRI